MGHKFEQTAMVFDVLCVEDKEIGIIIIYPRLSRLELSVLPMIANSIVIFFFWSLNFHSFLSIFT